MRFELKIIIACFIGLMLAVCGCIQDTLDEVGDDDDQNGEDTTEEKMSFTTVLISDAPSDNFSHINVTFSEVKIHRYT